MKKSGTVVTLKELSRTLLSSVTNNDVQYLAIILVVVQSFSGFALEILQLPTPFRCGPVSEYPRFLV